MKSGGGGRGGGRARTDVSDASGGGGFGDFGGERGRGAEAYRVSSGRDIVGGTISLSIYNAVIVVLFGFDNPRPSSVLNKGHPVVRPSKIGR